MGNSRSDPLFRTTAASACMRAKRLCTLLEWHDEVRLKPDPHRVGMSGA